MVLTTEFLLYINTESSSLHRQKRPLVDHKRYMLTVMGQEIKSTRNQSTISINFTHSHYNVI